MKQADKDKHTPGPFDLDTVRDRGSVAYQITAADGDVTVAIVDGYQGCTEGHLRRISAQENLANAKLFKAAPTLADALERVLEDLERRERDGISLDAYDKAKAALAEAGR